MKPLSFIIITYNRPHDLLELLMNLNQLQGVENLIEEIIIVNNHSSVDYSDVETFIDTHKTLPVKYFYVAENLGVARGRNYALRKGSAPYCIMLDDDAVLDNRDCLQNIIDIFSQSKTPREIAVISFKVLYFSNHQIQKSAFPHKRFSEFNEKEKFETYYYAGGAHAIKRDIIESLGMYPEDFFYGMEEYDLGYRIIDAGYSIVYSNRIVMLHKESPLGRNPKADKLRMMWVNKSKVAYRYLPKRYFYSTALMWSLQFLKLTGFNLNGYFKGWSEISSISSKEKRKPVSRTTLNYLKELKARLWY